MTKDKETHPYQYTVKDPYGDKKRDITLKFGISVYDALNFTYDFLINVIELEDDEARPELLNAYNSANFALGIDKLTEKEELLAAAFFALGMKMGKQVSTYPKLEFLKNKFANDRISRSKGGQHSQWRRYEDIIKRHIVKYSTQRSYTQQMACDEISAETGLELSTSTFSGWYKKHEQGLDIFKKSNK